MKIPCPKEKCPDDRVEVARPNKTRPDASLKRASCSKVRLTFLGIATVADSDLTATASVGAMIAPNMKASGKEKVSAIAKCKPVPTTSTEKTTKVTAIDSVCLRLRDSSRGEVPCPSLKSRGAMINKRKVLGSSSKVWD